MENKNLQQEKEQIQSLIERAEKLPLYDEVELDALRKRCDMVVRNIFGESNRNTKILRSISFKYSSPFAYETRSSEELQRERDSTWLRGKKELLSHLETMLEELNTFGVGGDKSEPPVPLKHLSNRIFIVHGDDETTKQSVARVVEKLGLETIILHEQPKQGRTIIEQLEYYADVGFAIILLSPDDMGYQANKQPVFPKLRAQQSVILQMGFFLGKLDRKHVFVLYPDGIGLELPEIYSGVLNTKYDAAGNWRFELVKELKAVGYDVDANKLVRSN